MPQSYIMLGGGVGDSYQPIEQQYRLSRQALQLVDRYHYPVHVLTKSTLVERDMDVLKQINEHTRAIVSFSLSSADDEISALVEPGVPPPSARLQTLKCFKQAGIATGVFLLPVIPYITDTPEKMEESIQKAKAVGVDFIIFGGMTLKDGRQKDYFYQIIKKQYPELHQKYQKLYLGDTWGNATDEYNNQLHTTFNRVAKKYHVPKRIPPKLYNDILNENDRVIVILEHLDYLLKLEGKPTPYGYAAYSISQLSQPLSTMKDTLQTLRGVGKTTENIILEILETGRSRYYETLLTG
jgi:DNA repair photolyase